MKSKSKITITESESPVQVRLYPGMQRLILVALHELEQRAIAHDLPMVPVDSWQYAVASAIYMINPAMQSPHHGSK